jgi:glucose-1-phosphate thymidylyltransferase
VQRIVEKPKPEEAPSNISSLPLYVFGSDILELLPQVQPSPRGEYELQDAIQMLIERTGRVLGVITDSRQQVTDAHDLLALNLRYLAQEPQRATSASPLPTGVELVAPVVIEAGVTVGPGCVIGPRVYIEAGARIGAGARMQDALVLRGSKVAASQYLAGEVVVPVANSAPKVI